MVKAFMFGVWTFGAAFAIIKFFAILAEIDTMEIQQACARAGGITIVDVRGRARCVEEIPLTPRKEPSTWHTKTPS